jgi:hypothetical protein
VDTLISWEERHRLIYVWELQYLQPFFAGLPVTLTKTQRKATVNSPYQSGEDARELEDWLEAQPQRFLLLGITAHSCDSFIWVASLFSGPLNGWWLYRKNQAAIPATFNSLVAELRKTSMLLNIRDDAINALLSITQGNMSYARYTQQSTNSYIDLVRTLRLMSSMFGSSMAWLILSRKLKQSRIDHIGVTMSSLWSYKIFLMIS